MKNEIKRALCILTFAVGGFSSGAGLFDNLISSVNDVVNNVVQINVTTNTVTPVEHPNEQVLRPPAPVVTTSPRQQNLVTPVKPPKPNVGFPHNGRRPNQITPTQDGEVIPITPPRSPESVVPVRPPEWNVQFLNYGLRQKEAPQASDEQVADYKAFLAELERLENAIKDSRNFICNEDYQDRRLVKSYYVTAKDRYETCKIKSDIVTGAISDLGLKSQILPDCEMPTRPTDFVAWTNEILSAMNVDLCTMQKAAERRKKYYQFLPEWEKLQNGYEKLMDRFGNYNVTLLSVTQDPDDSEKIPNRKSAISNWFLGRLMQHYKCGGGWDFLCPKTEEAIESWIASMRQKYADKSKPYLEIVSDVENTLKAVASWRDALKNGGGNQGVQLHALAFVDQNNAECIEGMISSALKNAESIPSEVEAYLRDEALRSRLHNVREDLAASNAKMVSVLSDAEEKSKLIASEVALWHDNDSWTNIPTVVGVRLGSGAYEVGIQLSDSLFTQRDVETTKADFSCQRIYTSAVVRKFPAVKDVRLEFGGHSPTQGLALVCGEYGFGEDVPYDVVVKKYTTGIPESVIPQVTREVVGYDLDELKTRNPWAAWQVDYYTRRGEGLRKRNDGLSACNLNLAKATAERVQAHKFCIATTLMKTDGYEVRIDSSVGERFASKVSAKDTLAISKLKGE